MRSKDTFRLSEIPVRRIRRIPTGIRPLDLGYGTTYKTSRKGRIVGNGVSGLPQGGISLWSGSPGVGKSRVCISVAASMNKSGHRILYTQNEVNQQQFREWTASQIAFPDEFIVHTSNEIDKQIAVIRKYEPHLSVLDSLNMIEGFQSPAVIRKVIQSYKAAIEAIEGHAILIGHLNKAGTVKGNNDIEYLIDVECHLRNVEDGLTAKQREFFESKGIDPGSLFYVSFQKNRYGPTTAGGTRNYVCFRHTAEGVECISSNFAVEEDEEEAPPEHRGLFAWLIGR